MEGPVPIFILPSTAQPPQRTNLTSCVCFPLNAPTTAVSNEIADITKDNYHFGKREEGRNSETGEQTSALPGAPLAAQHPDPAPRVLGAPEAGASHCLCSVSTGPCQSAVVKEKSFSSLLELLKMNQTNYKLAFWGTLPIRKYSFPWTDYEAICDFFKCLHHSG